MPPDQVGSVLDKLAARRGSSAELAKQIVVMLDQLATLDPKLADRAGAAAAMLRGPAKPGEKPNAD